MIIYNVPKEYGHISNDFEVICEGKSLDVLSCRVSAYPFNRSWPGHQRDKSQTEQFSYVRFGCDGVFTLKIRSRLPYNNVTIRPLSKKVVPVIEPDGSITATFPGKGQYTVELDGVHHAFAVFADPEKQFDVNKDDPDTLYFGPGVHDYKEGIDLRDGQTVYIDKDAVLYSGFRAKNVKNIRILGYGILDNSKSDTLPIDSACSEGIIFDGPVILDTASWALCFRGGRDIDIRGVKLLGFWRYNADGCDFCNVTNASIRDSFIRSFDDSIVVKGLLKNAEKPTENIRAENCVLWCDWGRALEIGAENCAPYIRDITFRNIDIIHGMDVMLDVQLGDRAMIENVLYEDIRVEYTALMQSPKFQKGENDVYYNANPSHMPFLIIMSIARNLHNHDSTTGSLRNVTFKNISVTTPDGRIPRCDIGSNVEGSEIADVSISDVYINGKKAEVAQDMGLKVFSGCRNIVLEGKKL